MRVLISIAVMIFTIHMSYSQSYSLVLTTDFDGKITSGSKEQLIASIREGKPVRVGWQLDFNEDKVADFDHWIEATFITILKKDVFTQIDPIYAQGPNIEIPQVEIYSDNTKWTAVIGTNGKLLNRFIQEDNNIQELIFDDSLKLTEEEKKEAIEKEEKRVEDMKKVYTWNVATFWSVQK